MSLIHDALKKAEDEKSKRAAEDNPSDDKISFNTNQSLDDVYVSEKPTRKVNPVILVLFIGVIGYAAYTFVGKSYFSNEDQVAEIKPPSTTEIIEVPPVQVETKTEVTEDPNLINAREAFRRGDYKAAEAIYSKAIATNESDAELWNNFGLTKKKLGDLPGAKEAYEKSLALKADQPIVLNNLGMVNLASEDRLSASLNFRKAIELDPNYADAHFNLATMMEDEGNWRSAIEEYKKFLETAKDLDEELREQVTLRVEDLVP